MDKRMLGDLEVSAMGMGCLGLTGGYGAVDPDTAAGLLRGAVERGVTLFDTAGFYADGDNERLVGRALAGQRANVVLATRGGVRAEAPGRPPTVVDGTPASLRAACEASLARLGVETIDLYYLARVDPEVPVEESVGALAQLRAEGKIGHIGLSEAGADSLRRAHAVAPITALESEYSLWERHIETEILPTARQLGIGLVAHTPLGKGFLTGTHHSPGEFGAGDMRRNHPRFQDGHFQRNQVLVHEARGIAERLGVSLARLALAWLLSRASEVVPIPGSRREEQLRDNAAAADLELSTADQELLASVFAAERVSGERHPAHRRRAGVAREG